jgi:hypothetical protein
MCGGGNQCIASTFNESTMILVLETKNPRRHPNVMKKCIYEGSTRCDNGDIFQKLAEGA